MANTLAQSEYLTKKNKNTFFAWPNFPRSRKDKIMSVDII